MRSYETDCLAGNQKRKLEEAGFFVYDMRDCGGEGYTVEKHVVVNRMGSVITDKELPLHCGERLNDDEFERLITGHIERNEIQDCL